MDYYSSRELASIYAISFIISLYLILLIGVQISDLTGTKVCFPNNTKACLVPATLYNLLVAKVNNENSFPHQLTEVPNN